MEPYYAISMLVKYACFLCNMSFAEIEAYFFLFMLLHIVNKLSSLLLN